MSEPQGLKFVRAAAGRLADLATVLAYPGFCARDPKYGITSRKPPQRDPSIEIHAPVPEGEVYSQLTIDGICDRGTGKSALCASRGILLMPRVRLRLRLSGRSTFCAPTAGLAAPQTARRPDPSGRIARFSSPVYPGDTLEVAIWSVDRGRAIVGARVIEW